MTSPELKTDVQRGTGKQRRPAGKRRPTPVSSAGTKTRSQKGAITSLLAKITKAPKGEYKPMENVIRRYDEALTKSHTAGRAVAFRVCVDPAGTTTVTPVEEISSSQAILREETEAPDAELQDALAAARSRGRLLAAEIINAKDMLSAKAFAKLLGTTPVTVNSKRQSGQLLGLAGAKRGFRFPTWQLDAEGKPFAALAALHEQLGDAWAVYRFLVQPHGELDGRTGLEALEKKIPEATLLEAAESVGRDFS